MNSSFKNRHIVHASFAALSGLRVLIQEKSAQREMVVLALGVAAFLYAQDIYGFLLILIALMMLSVEALNTAIETLADEVSEAFRERIKISKDLGAAAVLILVFAFGVTGLVFLMRNFPQFNVFHLSLSAP